MQVDVTLDGMSDLALDILGDSFRKTAEGMRWAGPRQRFLSRYLEALATHIAAEAERRRLAPESPAPALDLPDPPRGKVWLLVENFRRQTQAILEIRQQQQQPEAERAIADMKAVAAECARFTHGLTEAFAKLAR